MTAPASYSQSMLGTADKCLLALQWDIQGPPPGFVGKTSAARAVGTAYHFAHEVYYRWFIEPRETPAPPALDHLLEIAHKNLEWALAGNDEYRGDVREGLEVLYSDALPDAETTAAALTTMLTSYYDGGQAYPVVHAEEGTHGDWRVLGVEQAYHFNLDNDVPVRGSMDLVLADPESGILVDDQKTAGKMWDGRKHTARKQNQTPMYITAARRLFPGAPYYRFAHSIMTYKGKFERRITAPEPRHESAVAAKALSVKQLVEPALAAGMTLPANPASNLCSPVYCDHFDYCPFGRTLE